METNSSPSGWGAGQFIQEITRICNTCKHSKILETLAQAYFTIKNLEETWIQQEKAKAFLQEKEKRERERKEKDEKELERRAREKEKEKGRSKEIFISDLFTLDEDDEDDDSDCEAYTLTQSDRTDIKNILIKANRSVTQYQNLLSKILKSTSTETSKEVLIEMIASKITSELIHALPIKGKRIFLISNGFSSRVESLDKALVNKLVLAFWKLRISTNKTLQAELEKFKKPKSGTKDELLKRLKDLFVDICTKMEDNTKRRLVESADSQDDTTKKPRMTNATEEAAAWLVNNAKPKEEVVNKDKTKKKSEDGASDATTKSYETTKNAFEAFMGETSSIPCPCCKRNNIDLYAPAGRHAAHIIPNAKGGPKESWNLVPTCPQCNTECKTKNLLDFMGTSAKKFNLKDLVKNLYIHNAMPAQVKKDHGNPFALVEWMVKTYKPEEHAKYAGYLELDDHDWKEISSKFSFRL